MAPGRSIGTRKAIPVLLIAGSILAACADHQSRAEPAPGAATTVQVAAGSCGQGWSHVHGGTQSFTLVNDGDLAVQADLVDPKTGAVYAEAEGIGPGTSRPIQLTIGRGKYAFTCIPADGTTGHGPTVTVTTGPERGGPAAVPVSPAQLIAALRTYNRYVARGLSTLHSRVGDLQQAAATGDRAASERAWLPAHEAYETLGAAYDAFGDFADAIDGIPSGMPRDADHPDLTGFHRIEYLLWHGRSMAQVRQSVAKLDHDVAGLQADFPQERIDPNDLALRTHEILEASLQFELTGAADQGSGTNLATVDANITGTEAVLGSLEPYLRSRYPHLDRVHSDLRRLRSLIERHRSGAHWTPLEQLSRTDRERIDAAAGAALEDLAPIAAIAGVRRTE
ncbi:MAG TPA: EfeM/EfeO family lipoprotein [Mycobacteriales bacterium]|nr:EfeM/EfeO family lipoprotein [Mycobacteriales bacterium]